MFYLLIFKYLKLMIAMHIFFLIGQFQIFCLFKYKNFIPENRKSEKYKKSKYFVNKKKTFVSHLWFRVLGGKHGTTWCLNRETVRKILGPFRRGVPRFRRFAFRFRVLGTPDFENKGKESWAGWTWNNIHRSSI